MMKILNLTRGTALAERATLADTFFSRIKGLLGRSGLEKGEGLIITRCNSIHMFFMRFAIDAIFVDKNNQVVGLVKSLKPFRLSPIFFRANYVIELPANTVQESTTQVGDKILIEG